MLLIQTFPSLFNYNYLIKILVIPFLYLVINFLSIFFPTNFTLYFIFILYFLSLTFLLLILIIKSKKSRPDLNNNQINNKPISVRLNFSAE